MTTCDVYELYVPGIRPWVSLGCTPEERSHPQRVEVALRIQFEQEPSSCRTDQMGDMVCYQKLSELALQAAQSRPFLLIESLAAFIFDCIVDSVCLEGVLFEVTIAKPNHPVSQVHQPIVFTYRRRIQQKSSSH